MITGKGKAVGLFIGTVLVPAAVAGSLYVAANNSFTMSKASPYSVKLDNSNSPEIINGNAERLDNKNVTWEYHNVLDNSNGHVILNGSTGNPSYFGISSSTEWGYTNIEEITVTFSGDELWLLTSVDGIEWSECVTLKSGEMTTEANDWRYVRFYSYQSSISIKSVDIGYGCSSDESAKEDVDAAKAENVISVSSNLTYRKETENISPLSDGGEAVSFTKSGSGGTTIVLGFGRKYLIGDIVEKKIEFDMYTTSQEYGKTLRLMDGSTERGAAIDSSKHSAYKFTKISGAWYHVQVPVSALASKISGYKSQDDPGSIATKEINGIKINAGTCVIDNLRLTGSPCESGIYNNGKELAINSVYWVKASWVGVLHSATMSFSPNIAEQCIPGVDKNIKNGSPFYIKGKSVGTTTVTITIVCGYDRRVITVTTTLTIK